MPQHRIAVATRIAGAPLRDSIRWARDIGADAVQFDVRAEVRPAEFTDTGRRQLLHMLEENHLRICSLLFPTRRTFYEQEQLEARVAGLKAALQFAYQLKAPLVTARVGRIPEDPQSLPYQILRDVVNDIARFCNQCGATLAVTPTREDPQQLARFLDEITAGPVGVNFDPAIFVQAGRDAIDAFRVLYSRVVHVTVRDAIRDADGSGLEVAVGRGEVEWDELLAVLSEAGYRGPLLIDRTIGDNKSGDAARTVEFLRNLLPG